MLQRCSEAFFPYSEAFRGSSNTLRGTGAGPLAVLSRSGQFPGTPTTRSVVHANRGVGHILRSSGGLKGHSALILAACCSLVEGGGRGRGAERAQTPDLCKRTTPAKAPLLRVFCGGRCVGPKVWCAVPNTRTGGKPEGRRTDKAVSRLQAPTVAIYTQLSAVAITIHRCQILVICWDDLLTC